MRLAPILALPAALLAPAVVRAACADPATCGCTVSASGLSFGAYDPQAGAPSDSVGTLALSCTSEDAARSTVSIALAGSGGAGRRALQGTGASLAYNLYVDPARTTIWGDEATGGVVAPFPANGGTQLLRIYGRIPARQPIPPGAYSDTITILLTY